MNKRYNRYHFLIILLTLTIIARGQDIGIKTCGGINPYFSIGPYFEIKMFSLEIQYAYDGQKAVENDLGPFSSAHSPILTIKTGFIYTFPKSNKFSIFSTGGYYFQFFRAKVKGKYVDNSTFGDMAKNTFSNFILGFGFRYNYNSRLKFSLNLESYYWDEGKKYYFDFGSTTRSKSVYPIGPMSINVGIIYLFVANNNKK